MKVKTIDRLNLIGKIVVFTDEIENHEMDFDSGMKAKIKSITPTGDGVYKFIMDFSEFEEYNKKFMKANYYNRDGVPCETWENQSRYANDLANGAEIYLAFEDDTNTVFELPFELDEGQTIPPTLEQALDALERTLAALKQRNLNKPYACLDEVFAEANHVLKKGGRQVI